MYIFYIIVMLLFGGMSLGSPEASANKDSDIKNDVSRVNVILNTYMVNNRGSLPSSQQIMSGDFVREYMKDDLGTSYKYKTSGEDQVKVMTIHIGLRCDGSKGSNRVFSVSTKLSSGDRYCLGS